MWTGMRAWLSRGWARLGLQPLMKEAWYPVDASGQPDLRRYTEPIDYYIRMYQNSLAALRDGPRGRAGAKRVWRLRVHALWGLIAKGAPASVYAAGLLQRSEPEAREDGVAILAELGGNEDIVDRLLAALVAETESQARDSLLAALGRMKNRRAIPVLAAVIRDEQADEDTRWTAVESLGRLVRKRFLHQKDPVLSAREWLDRHGA